ncbi:penicillin-binding transpeptidase domain-containing protein [Desulfosporosinus sp. BICA1-9]|uniref:penicillin-binding transpeptidase domain-containing protein n=1 Tax=Desulfosporosinus sp. BICA1-9 TaxID=1531958 RepID=UPI00054C61E4|nr:penicillin-binding transpeptidase domain-containing protein [Desulfosporosinus sp. BICA1-9]KJS50850.1 MAG: stage V sporulation protein D [Peptococcaceae bacterium BRH_c23]KJS79390.1 MAG: stage V sporulation protein D [Desulfosporosinus sp. BICA1-9]HBW36101.1 PASTA domain-containing protein [Desulfosporosinus sp.]
MSPFVVMRKRIAFLFLCVSIFLIVLIVRLGFVQLSQGADLRKKADDSHFRGVPVAPKRGNIEDRQGNILAMSVSSETVYAVPAEVRQSGRAKEMAVILAPLLGKTAQEIEARITKRSALEYVQKRVKPEVAAQVRALNLPGIGTTEDSQRYYPNGTLAAHIIGYAGIDSQGLEGIELTRETELKGIPGSILQEFAANGIPLPQAEHQYLAPKQGDTVRLTIDKNIQAFAERELQKLMTGQGINMNGKVPKNASILVMDPNTGEMLALASAPTFDPNHYQEADPSTRRNIAIQNGYEPGSTFKIITLAAALEEKKIKLTEHFFDKGAYTVLGKNVRCWKAGGHGDQTYLQVAENSCNPGFIEMGQRLGMDNFYKYLRDFGFGKKTGIEMSGEALGILANKKKATALDLATMSIGQTNNVTPIQLLAAVSAVANGGTLMKPQLVAEIVGPSGRVITPFEKEEIRRVISEESSKLEREVLESVVTNGTGRRSFLPGYRVAGKTGTAQKVANGGYIQGEYVASFVAFAPADKPKLAILCVIDGVPFYGGVVASPVVQTVLLDSLRYLGVKPDPQAPLTPGKPLPGLEFPPIKKAAIVPSVLGQPLAEAEKILAQAGFKTITEGKGEMVLDQIPHGDAQVEAESNVLLYLGADASTPTLARWWEDEDEDIEAIRSLTGRIPISASSLGH